MTRVGARKLLLGYKPPGSYPYSGGSMDFWYTIRLPINAVVTTDKNVDRPVFFWNRQPLTIYAGL